MPDYLPRREGDRVAFAGRLAERLVGSPGDYGVTGEDAAAYAARVETAAAAWRLSRMPDTRTRVSVQAKDTALADMVKQTRGMVTRLRAYLATGVEPAVRANRLAALGLRVASRSRRELRVPGRLPRVRVSPTLLGKVAVCVTDPAHPQRKAKPRGVGGLVAYCRVWSAGSAAWGPWWFAGAQTRMRFELDYPKGAEAGDRLEVSVRWASPTGKMGPGSAPGSVVLPPKYAMRMAQRRAA